MRDQVDFLYADKHQSFLQVCIIGFDGHAQSTQNNKFAISLKYSKKEVRDKYHFLHGYKHQSFLQAGSVLFTGLSQTYPKHPK